jgi:hypothetical protein
LIATRKLILVLVYLTIISLAEVIQDVELKSVPYFNMSNLFTKVYNMLYYTTNLYLQ